MNYFIRIGILIFLYSCATSNYRSVNSVVTPFSLASCYEVFNFRFKPQYKETETLELIYLIEEGERKFNPHLFKDKLDLLDSMKNHWNLEAYGKRNRNSSLKRQLDELRVNSSTTILDSQDAKVALENWKLANEYILDKVRKGIDPSYEDLLKLHKIMLKNLKLKDANMKAGAVRETSYYHDFLSTAQDFPVFKAVDVDQGLRDFFRWFESNKHIQHPVVLATISYQRLLAIRPFLDGNGRTIRLFVDWILMKNKFPPPVFQYDNGGLVRTFNHRDVPLEVAMDKFIEAIKLSHSYSYKFL